MLKVKVVCYLNTYPGYHGQSSHLTRCEHYVIMAGRQQDSQTVDEEEYFDKVVKGVSHKWDDLARKLGFDRNEIKGIGTTEPSPDHRCREMLDRWRNREGREATLQVLNQALINIDERLTAESLDGKKTRRKRKRKRKPKQPKEDNSSEESSLMGNDPHNGPSPSHNYFIPVAKAVGFSWVKFAVEQLGLTAEDVVNIQVQHPSSTERQALQALELWRDRRGRKACRVKLAGALRKGGFLHTADELETYDSQEVKMAGLFAENTTSSHDYVPDLKVPVMNGMKPRKNKKQKTGASGGQHLNGKAENGSKKKPSASRSGQGHTTSGSSGDSSEEESEPERITAEIDRFRRTNGSLKRKRKIKKEQQEKISVKRKKLKKIKSDSKGTSDNDQDNVNGHNLKKEAKTSIHSTYLRIHEKVFDKETFQNDDEFKRCMDSMTKIESVISDTDEEQFKLQSAAKLRIKKRVNNKIAEAAENMFSDSVLDPANRETFHKMAECFKMYAASVKKAKRGCVLCYLDFADVDCYDTFWRGYSDGSLSNTLTRELITDDMRAAEGGADLYIHVRVLHSATEEGDFSDQDPSGTAGRGPPHPGPSGEHTGQGPPAPGSGNHGDDTPPGYHGDGTGGLQVSGGGDVIQVKREPAEQVPSCCMMGNVKSEIKGELVGPFLKREETEIKGELAGPLLKREETELDRQLAAVADHLGSMWERLALSLGFTTDYIRDLTARQPPSLPHQLICDWMERNAGDVTLDQLVQALRDAGIHEVADAAASGQLFETAGCSEAEKEKPEDGLDATSPDRETSSAKGKEKSEAEYDDRKAENDDDAAKSDELFLTETDCGSAKGKADGDLDTANPAEKTSPKQDSSDSSSSSSSSSSDEESDNMKAERNDDGRLLLKRKRADSSSDSISSSDEEEKHRGAAVGDTTHSLVDEGSAKEHLEGTDHTNEYHPDHGEGITRPVLLARNTKEVPEYEEPSGPSAVPLLCSSCKQTMQAEYSYICTTCEQYNLCVVCYKMKKGHSHEMQWGLQLKDVETLQPSLSPQEARRRRIERCIQNLIHACQCRDANCSLPSCQKMKRVMQHTKSCKRKTTGGCPICKQLVVLCVYHAKHCQEQKCPVPFCPNIKHRLRQKQLQDRLRQAQELRRRMSSLQTHSTNSKETQVNTPQCTLTTTLYPTGEDALVWNDCIRDFFKTDEDTARSIQKNWPSSLLVKHLIRDRFFHSYLCEYWEQLLVATECQTFPSSLTLASFVEFVTEMSSKQFCFEKPVSVYDSLCLLVGKAAFESQTNNNSVYVYKSQFDWGDIQQASIGWLKEVDSSEAKDAFQFVHDSIRQFLMAYWVAHTVRTQTDCTELLRVCAENSDHLPITCCSLAHLLSMTDSSTHLQQFVTLLMQKQGGSNDFNHLLSIVTTTAETNQLDALSPFIGNLFPDKTLDLSALPEISLHGLHCLTQLIRRTTLIHTIGLPGNRSIQDVLKQYPFEQKPVSNVDHANQVKYLRYLPLFECMPSTRVKSSMITECRFAKTDKQLDDNTIHQYLQSVPSLKKITVRSETLSGDAFGCLTKSLVFTPNITTVIIGLKYISREAAEQAMWILYCLHKLENVELIEYWPTRKFHRWCYVSVRCSTFSLVCKTRQKVWEKVLFFYSSDIRELTLHGIVHKRTKMSKNRMKGHVFVWSLPSLRGLNLTKLKFDTLSLESSTWFALFKRLVSPTTDPTLTVEGGEAPVLEVLSCTNCGLTSDDILSLKGQLATLQNLKELDLDNNDISDEAVPCLAEGLGSCQNLKKVNLSYNRLSSRGDLLPLLPNLEEIDLSHNAISDEAVPGLAKGLSSCQSLKHVNLTDNKISNNGALLLLLQDQCKGMQVKTARNNISDDLVSLLANRQNASQVIRLFLMPGEYPTGIVHPLHITSVNLLLQFLPQLPNLQDLALCVSCQGEEEAELTDQLYGVQSSLRTLKLTARDLSMDKMTRLLMLILQQFPLLEEIDLSCNDISDEAVPGFAKGLGLCQNLKKVDLRHNKLSNVGDLMKAFTNLPILTRVYIENNSIRDESLPAIAAWLNVSTAVERVDLDSNRFSAEGVRDFVRTLKGKAYWGLFNDLLYDGSLADMGEAVESGGEGARREEQQWERFRSWLRLIDVKVRQLTVLIRHRGPRSNNTLLSSP